MSDFDREAERERLREQFERDEAKREATERMSELLLKGATMTNKHCDTCGDPIFRHDGQEFCPTCHGGPGGVGTVQDGAAGDRRQGDATGGPADTADQRADPTESAAGGAERAGLPADAPGRSRGDATGHAGPGPGGPTAEPEDAATGEHGATVEAPDRENRRDPDRVPPGVREGTGEDDLAAARASLTRSLAALARRAEATEDVSRAREYLAAAREAAEALDAAERVGR